MRKRLFFLFSALIMVFLGLVNSPSDSVIAQQDHQYYFPFFAQHHSFKGFSSIGPDGGTVTSIEIDPTNSSVIYAGTWGHGIYKSENGGSDWTHYSDGFRAGFVFDLAIDPENPQHLLASAYRYGAYESFNGGRTWQKTTGMPEETVVYSFAFHPEDSDIVYAAVRLETIYNPSPHYPGAVYKSTNGGSHWIKQDYGLPDDYVYDVAIDPNNPDILYTAMHVTGVYKSVNGGANWFSVNNNIHYRDVRSLAINPHNSTVYAGMYDGKGVAYSTNGGASWSTINNSVYQNLYVYKLQLDPSNYKSLFLNTPDGLYRCKDTLYPHSQTGCVRIAHDDRFVFALALDRTSASGTGDVQTIYTGLRTYGIHKSSKGGQNFAASYSGLKANVILSVLNDPESQGILYASVLGRGVFKSFDSGQTWQSIQKGIPSQNINHLTFSPGNSQVIYAATQADGIYISTDGGNNWSASNTGIAQIKNAAFDSARWHDAASFRHPSFSWMDQADIDALERSNVEEKSLAYLACH